MSEFTEQVIAESIDYLVAHYNEQPDLAYLAGRAGYDVTHFQKLFKAKVGVSPKRLVQYMNMRHARELLAAGGSTIDVAQKTGLSGTGRLYDLFVQCEAVTPGDVQHKGRGLTVSYGYHHSPIGEILIGQTDRGVCYLGFLVDQDRDYPFERMCEHLPYADYIANDNVIRDAAMHIMKIWQGRGAEGKEKLRLDLHGTNFQIQVWQALLKIPLGETLCYMDVAKHIGRPKSSRAVGNAVGSNPISLLIPCHRVIRATGIIDNYGWGSPRKKQLLAMEGNISIDIINQVNPKTSRIL